MASLLVDIETDGLLRDLTKIHVISILDLEDGSLKSYARHRGELDAALSRIRQSDKIVGHNIINFDLPAIQKIYPGFDYSGEVEDTLVLSRVIWPDIGDEDDKRIRRSGFPPKLRGRHSLKAWGYRLGMLKGTYAEDTENAWDHWTPAMEEYCEQDVKITESLYCRINNDRPPAQCVELEHDTARVCRSIESAGFGFDVRNGSALFADLAARATELQAELADVFGAWWQPGDVRTPAKSIRYKDPLKANRVEGAAYTPIERIQFNPGSRVHIEKVLRERHGWVPEVKTETGRAQITETVLSELAYAEAQLLSEFFTVQKRVSQLATGDNAWLRLERDGVIYGSINPNGAVTGRATHASPNIAQVPAGTAKYGKECRELFLPTIPGGLLVGTDMDGLELRCLAHYLHRYDEGEYGRTVVHGDKSAGTDVHSVTARALGFDPKDVYEVSGKQRTGRDLAKTFIYAFLYRAGAEKIGKIVGGGAKKGKQLKTRFEKANPAFKMLSRDVGFAVKRRGYLKGLDGRRLPIRSEHSALNTLLQSAGAILCKRWMCQLDAFLRAEDLTYDINAWVHDELQISVEEELTGRRVITLSNQAAIEAGEYFAVNVALAADGAIGGNWSETH